MTKNTEPKAPGAKKRVPTYQFNIYQSEENPNDYIGEFFDKGELKQSLYTPNSYQYISTVLGIAMRLAIHDPRVRNE